MKNEKIHIEYPLKSVSTALLWNTISNPLGLAEWFAENVTVEGDKYTFSWDEADETAYLIKTKLNEYIRFQWEDDKNTDIFFEIRIVVQELSGEVALHVTDFAEKNDVNDTILIWDKQIEDLRRKYGI